MNALLLRELTLAYAQRDGYRACLLAALDRLHELQRELDMASERRERVTNGELQRERDGVTCDG